ncbi:MAG TPA: hypothetical protein VHN79_09165 [Lacunisphaera sp.]|nr:hypothetical protein [Lacunisphaera sp.]
MKTKDCLIAALAPVPVLLIPLVGVMVSEDWKWSFFDFVAAWFILALTTFLCRLLVTRRPTNLAYRLGAILAVAAGFLITWISLAVQIIGDENPANVLYLAVIVTGLAGVGLARFQAVGMARAAFATAVVTFLVPVVGVILWPADFSPGVWQVFMLNSVFVLMFAAAGLLFRHAGGQAGDSVAATPA